MPYRRRKNGFTLIELSIVLVVVGLIAGGIMAGRSMIRQSQVQNILVDVNRYTKAFNAFHDKFNALPGDMGNAESYWGTASGGCPNGSGTGTQTCNGNSNGHISDANDTTSFHERFRAWQQLAAAGFITGNYSGYAGGSTYDTCLLGSAGNCPPAPVSAGAYQIYNNDYADSGSVTGFFAAQYGHIISVGALSGDLAPQSPLLTTSEALALDTKSDDGLPGTGSILSYTSAATLTPNCTSSSNSATATYLLTNSGAACALIFKTGF